MNEDRLCGCGERGGVHKNECAVGRDLYARQQLGRELTLRLWYWRSLNKKHLGDEDWKKVTAALTKARDLGWLDGDLEFP